MSRFEAEAEVERLGIVVESLRESLDGAARRLAAVASERDAAKQRLAARVVELEALLDEVESAMTGTGGPVSMQEVRDAIVDILRAAQ